MTNWSIWSFCYALGKLPLDFLNGAPINSNKGTVDAPMLVHLLRASDGQTILVDTGFESANSMTGAGFRNFVRSDLLLERFGYSPDAIDKVVLTHMHFDHAGNFHNFPNAKVYLQRHEYDAWKNVLAKHDLAKASKADWVFSSLNLNDFELLEQAIAQGKVEFLDGDTVIAPGVSCRLARDTHTFGSQWVHVDTGNGHYAIAGDCCYTFENLDRMWPPGYSQGNPWNMLETFTQMKAVAGDQLERLVPGHDITLFDRYPSATRHDIRFAEIALAAQHDSLLSKSQ